ncbi:hypothetical protein [Bradyrhizobium paxllaeri]|uniref:hypothetical protein n=1 Tax=Bradyrhizobium paxllaeri TaxID=190148 RepID=UPI001146F2D4|nr:hypothetical protein [Bradyrhizobium paxllaeri]
MAARIAPDCAAVRNIWKQFHRSGWCCGQQRACGDQVMASSCQARRKAGHFIAGSACKRDKARTNHNQAHDDNGKKTGRSKIFAHDGTYDSIKKSPVGQNFDAQSFEHTALPQIATHGFGLKAIKPSVRFSMSSSTSENDFIGAVPSLRATLRMKHPHETERPARKDPPRPSSLK